MKPTYPDTCLERAAKATKGPWWLETEALSDMFIAHGSKTDLSAQFDVLESYDKDDFDFIAHSRTDVVELARRLKRACEELRAYAEDEIAHKFIDELEAMPEEK